MATKIAIIGPQGTGVPAGGTAGQIIVKQSSENFGTEWSDWVVSSTEPISPVDGTIWMNAITHALSVYVNDQWRELVTQNDLDGTGNTTLVNAGYF